MTAAMRVFWVDTDHDQANASDGVSRYGAYVRQAGRGFFEDAEDHEDPAAALAARAWNTACPPVMVPGFVAWHPRVLSARAERDDWNGDLLLTVDLVSTLPGAVALAAGWSWRSWQYCEWFERFEVPPLREAGRDKALVPTVTASVLIPPTCVVPQMSPGSPDWRSLAVEAVRGICRVLNTELGPIVAALDEGR